MSPLYSNVEETWFAPALINSWANLDSATYVPFGIRKKRNGDVEIRGVIAYGSVSTIFVLPAGYRPPKDLFFITASWGGAMAGKIYANGNVDVAGYIGTGQNGMVSFHVLFSTLT